MKLDNRVAIVTGGSSGIGAEVSVQLAAEGANVVVVASSDKAKAQIVVDRIEAAGGKAAAFVCDVRDGNAVAELVKNVEGSLGEIEILINAAGIYDNTPIGDTDEALLDLIVDVNIKGTFRMIMAVCPLMKERRKGKVVNFSSVAGVMGIQTQSLYCGTKAGIILMTQAMALELAPFDVNINTIAPGATKTPINEPLRTQPEYAHVLEAFEKLTPSNTTFSDPAEIARMVVFLSSDDARPMHGSVVLMDEGVAAGI